MQRRDFLKRAGSVGLGLAFAPTVLRTALAGPVVSDGPYGPLGEPDDNGIRLPEGFTSRVIAVSGSPVDATGYLWHPAPDGGATFPTDDGGWIYTSNSEVPIGGGCGAVRFDRAGEIVAAYSILQATRFNCAGGATPWGTWLSCEEQAGGYVWECDPTKPGQGVARPAMGAFSHEAVAVDPVRGHCYLTEDQPVGRFYRFTPEKIGDLSAGTLEAAVMDPATGAVTWVPAASGQGTTFDGGEGCDHHGGRVWFTTKGDEKVWCLDIGRQIIWTAYDANALDDAPLRGVDNLIVTRNGDVLVAEDGDDLHICMLAGIDGRMVVTPILQVTGQDASELAGPAFSPDGTRLYFSSQRGPAPAGAGITYEVSGPFRW